MYAELRATSGGSPSDTVCQKLLEQIETLQQQSEQACQDFPLCEAGWSWCGMALFVSVWNT